MNIYYFEMQCRNKHTGNFHPLVISTLAANEDDARAQIKDSLNFVSPESDLGDLKEGILYKHCACFPVGIRKEDIEQMFE